MAIWRRIHVAGSQKGLYARNGGRVSVICVNEVLKPRTCLSKELLYNRLFYALLSRSHRLIKPFQRNMTRISFQPPPHKGEPAPIYAKIFTVNALKAISWLELGNDAEVDKNYIVSHDNNIYYDDTQYTVSLFKLHLSLIA